jgi:hypothetical protein
MITFRFLDIHIHHDVVKQFALSGAVKHRMPWHA